MALDMSLAMVSEIVEAEEGSLVNKFINTAD